jgi:hypothetical protein
MITTRIVDVAKSCSPSNEDYIYEMKPLSEADSKKLFFKRIFGCEESCLDSLKEASKDILKKMPRSTSGHQCHFRLVGHNKANKRRVGSGATFNSLFKGQK